MAYFNHIRIANNRTTIVFDGFGVGGLSDSNVSQRVAIFFLGDGTEPVIGLYGVGFTIGRLGIDC